MYIQTEIKTTKEMKTTKKAPLTFIEILNNPEFKKLVEAIEYGSNDPQIIADYKAELLEKTGFDYDGE